LNFQDQIERERKIKSDLETKDDLSVFNFKNFQITAFALLNSTQTTRSARIAMFCDTSISLFLPMMKMGMTTELQSFKYNLLQHFTETGSYIRRNKQ
jgi:hypothetical protein